MELSPQQLEQLTHYRALVQEANRDTAIAMETGYFSDAKSSVSWLGESELLNDLPPAIRESILSLAREAWRAIVSPGDTYFRTSRTLFQIGELERLLTPLITTPVPPPAARPGPPPVFEIRITVAHSFPPIWRRILIDGHLTLDELSYAIQVVMGWSDDAPHIFSSGQGRFGVTHSATPTVLKDEAKHRIADLFSRPRERASYSYEPDCFWELELELEDVYHHLPDEPLPRCIAGARAAPDEESGGIVMYEHLIRVVTESDHPDHAEVMEDWGPIDAEDFDLNEVNDLLRLSF